MKTIYLLHFSRPFKHARHYMGQTTSLRSRLKRHKEGRGARLLAAVAKAGISTSVVRTWTGRKATRDFERKLKTNYSNRDLCPRCSGSAARRRGVL